MESKFYIGFSENIDIRFHSASGGIGTSLIQYLLSLPEYGTAMTFRFNKEKCQYEPFLIYNFEDYNNCGSIYQDIDIINFVKNNIDNIQSGCIVTCMPCQVNPIRNLLNKHNIRNFIISFCCSGQTTIEGTWKYYDFMGIKKNDVVNLQYRGNGWPSGIQISLNNGDTITRNNWTYPWTIIHTSLLFRPQRCIACREDVSFKSDISLCDPWLKRYREQDKIGNTLFLVNSEDAEKYVNVMVEKKFVHISESSYEEYYQANGHNKRYKESNYMHKNYCRIIKKMNASIFYKKIFTYSPFLLNIHNKIILRFLNLLKNRNIIQ